MIVQLIVGCAVYLMIGSSLGAEINYPFSVIPSNNSSAPPSQIVDKFGNQIKFKCINWAAHMETHLPEGLAHHSFDELAQRVVDMGFNCVRLCLSVQQMLLRDNHTLGESIQFMSNHTRDHFLVKQSSFIGGRDIWTVKSWDMVEKAVDTLGQYGIFVLADNHMSEPKWCCDNTDGNRWWGDRGFPVDPWLESLKFMAEWSNRKPQIVAVALRNEVDQTLRWRRIASSQWFHYMRQGAILVHGVNPNVLVFVGGIRYSSDLKDLRYKRFVEVENGMPLSLDNKLVYEVHTYNFIYMWPFFKFRGPQGGCDYLRNFLNDGAGFMLTDVFSATRGPLILSEFGLNLDTFNISDPKNLDVQWFTCLTQYMRETDIHYAFWTLVAHYYIRQDTKDSLETFGLVQVPEEARRLMNVGGVNYNGNTTNVEQPMGREFVHPEGTGEVVPNRNQDVLRMLKDVSTSP